MIEAELLGLGAIAPELMLVFVSLVVLVMDLVMRGRDSDKLGWASLVGLAVTGFMLIARFNQDSGTALGMVAIDKFGSFFKLFTVAALAVVVYFVMSDRRERKHGVGEYYFLLLGAGIGIFFMVGTNNLLLLMLGLELLSLASYSLAGFHKGEKRSAEAAMKYVVFGGLSAGVMLYGISLLYGLTGTLDLAVMAGGQLGVAGDADTFHRSLGVAIQESPGMVGVAMVLILSGFAYKITLAPFHFWAPDVYDGAPTPVTTFLAVTSKAAGFGALLRFLWVLFGAEGTQAAVQAYGLKVGELMAVLAAVTMTLGNLAALRQESIKRMLAYSSIAHAGYVMMGVVAMTLDGFEASLFYLAAYYFMNLGAFGFLLYFQGVTGKDTYESIKGMGYRAPLVSLAMVAFLVSLTGIPPTVGFAGKYLLFAACIKGGFLWLAVVAGINSALSLFYYIKVARYLFLASPAEKTAAPQPGLVGFIAVLAVLTILFGVYFSPLIELARDGMHVLTAGL